MWVFLKEEKFGKMFLNSLIVFISSILPFVFIYFFDHQGIESLQIYFERQVIGSIENVQTVTYRWYLLQRVLEETLTMSVLMVVLYFVSKKQSFKLSQLKLYKKESLIMLVLAYSGIVPMLISMKQRGFYMLTVFPFLALAVALFITPIIHSLIQKYKDRHHFWKIFYRINILLIIAVLLTSIIHSQTMGRDKEKLIDIYTVCEYFESEQYISVSPELYEDWSAHGYFARLDKIHLDTKNHQHDFFLSKKGNTEIDTNYYKKVKLDLDFFSLYQKK